MVLPRVSARVHRDETVVAIVVSEAPARPREIGVERRPVAVQVVAVAPRRVCLPNLHQLAANGPARRVAEPPRHDDALAHRLAGVAQCEIVVLRRHQPVSENGPAFVRQPRWDRPQLHLRGAQPGRVIARVVVRRVECSGPGRDSLRGRHDEPRA